MLLLQVQLLAWATTNVLLVASAVSNHDKTVRVAYDVTRVRHIACCVIVEEHWPSLDNWNRDCKWKRTALGGKIRRLWANPPPPGDVVDETASLCDDDKSLLSEKFLRVFFFLQRRLCAGLPSTHSELVRSAYATFVVEDPLHEDTLAAMIEEACSRIKGKETPFGRNLWGLGVLRGLKKLFARIPAQSHIPYLMEKLMIYDNL